MIHFFGNQTNTVYAVQTQDQLSTEDISKLNWLFGNATKIEQSVLSDFFVGPRATMITPWSTNAVEITLTMGISGIIRMEEFQKVSEDFSDFDPMLLQKYTELNQEIYTINIEPEAILNIGDIASYNKQEGLALSDEEVIFKEVDSKLYYVTYKFPVSQDTPLIVGGGITVRPHLPRRRLRCRGRSGRTASSSRSGVRPVS